MLSGRTRERRVLADLLEGARASRGGALRLVGEAGIGKTALLEDLVASAGDLLVVSVSGIEAERELPFAAVHQLLSPFLDRLAALPERQREAVRTAFGLGAGSVPEVFNVALGVLRLVRELAADRPVLVVVDDEQWLDRASVRVLGFLARRVGADRVAVVFAARVSAGEAAGIPELTVRGLSHRESGALFDASLTGRLDPSIRQQVLSEARGNPLALVELPRGVTPSELAGGFALPGALPLSHRIEATYRRRLERLPPPARRWLLLAAADPVGAPATLWAAAGCSGLGPDAADRAVASGLVSIGTRVSFCHPLARSAVYLAAGVEERRRAHAVLAHVTDADLDPDRRAWHRSQAVIAPADDVADELHAAADRAQDRGGAAAAAAFLERSATLSSRTEVRSRRMLAAAMAHRDAGSLDRASELLDAAAGAPGDDVHRGRISWVRGQIAMHRHQCDEAVTHLVQAAALLSAESPVEARRVSLEAVHAAMWAGGAGGHVLRDIAAGSPRPEPGVVEDPRADIVDLTLAALRTRIVDGYAAAAPVLRRAVEALEGASLSSTEHRQLLRSFLSLPIEAWDAPAWRAVVRRAVDEARVHGALTALPTALKFFAFHQIHVGDLRGAARTLEESDAVTAATDGRTFRLVHTVLAAWQGDAPRLAELLEELRGAHEIGQASAVYQADAAEAVFLNAAGRFEEALAVASRAFRDDPVPAGPQVVPEIVDAASRTGRVDVLEDIASWLAERELATPGDWVTGVAERVRAFLAADADAEAHHRRSVELLSGVGLGLEHARSLLAYGEWLRRRARRADARRVLEETVALYQGFGVAGFAARARRELDATGRRVVAHGVARPVALTAQETQIAVLAGQGLSNPQIGERLFISRRTVQYHLHKVFAKLDITSREHLGHALADVAHGNEPHGSLGMSRAL